MTHELLYTELEMQIIDIIKDMLNSGIDQIFIGDIECAGIDSKKARGALGSLVKKGKIDVNKRDGGLISLF
jgi:hypothetical protein